MGRRQTYSGEIRELHETRAVERHPNASRRLDAGGYQIIEGIFIGPLHLGECAFPGDFTPLHIIRCYLTTFFNICNF
ncbi:MAG TPA: hypothetical protein VMW42_11045 [Desulfatiglandales bacterium]|nr:hypothetical protein [Desulfatiglandales bacterium]